MVDSVSRSSPITSFIFNDQFSNIGLAFQIRELLITTPAMNGLNVCGSIGISSGSIRNAELMSAQKLCRPRSLKFLAAFRILAHGWIDGT